MNRVEVRLQKEKMLILTEEWTLGRHVRPSYHHPPTALYSPTPQIPRGWGHSGPCYFLLLAATAQTMELWRQLRQAGLVPPGLGPPPRALRGVPPSWRAGQTLMSLGTDTEGTRECLLWIWEELVSEEFGGARDRVEGGGRMNEWQCMKIERARG